MEIIKYKRLFINDLQIVGLNTKHSVYCIEYGLISLNMQMPKSEGHHE